MNSEHFHLSHGISSVIGMQLPMSWPAPASTRALAQKVLDFLGNFRNSIYLEIILVTQVTIWSLKLKTKATEFLVCGITNINIKQK